MKISQADCNIIKRCARYSAGCHVLLEPGLRYNIDGKYTALDYASAVNVALVSQRPDIDDWDDTDLDQQWDWSGFRRMDIPANPEGFIMVDFYCYSTGHYGQLETNVQALWKDGKLIRVTGTGDGTIWEDGQFLKGSLQ